LLLSVQFYHQTPLESAALQKLYSHLKFFNYPEHIATIKQGQISPPIHVRIKPINQCNHDCWYCAYRSSDLQLGENMKLSSVIPEKKMMEIADDLINMGTKAITFSGGGEPLLYKPISRVVEHLGSAGLKIGCLTNGSNLKGKVAQSFANHGDWIRVSIDAWDDVSYAKSRGAKTGEFSKLLNNLTKFVALKSDCILGISFIISHDNADHIDDICRKLKDIGVNHIKLSGAVISNDQKENSKYHLKIKTRVKTQIESVKHLENDTFSILNHYHDLPSRFEKNYDFCPYLTFLTVIGADQKVYTCQDKAYTEAGLLGSIENRPFKDFWFSEENKRRLYELNPRNSCQHHCVTQAKNEALYEFITLNPEHAPFV